MKTIVLGIAALALLAPLSPAEAREVTVTGGLSTSYDVFDRRQKGDVEEEAEIAKAGETSGGTQEAETTPSNDSGDDEDDYRKIIVRPLIAVEMTGEKDLLSIRYEPGFTYDELNDEHDVNHRASLTGRRQLTRQWQVQLSDSYEIRDDAEDIAEAVDLTEDADTSGETDDDSRSETPTSEQTTTDRNRRRYATNTLQALTSYEYGENRTVTLGYTNSLLRNIDDIDEEYQDYDRHDGLFAFDHRFSEKWRLSFAGHYVRGLFESPNLELGEDQATLPVATDDEQDGAVDETQEEEITEEDLTDDVTEYSGNISLESAYFRSHPLSLGYGLRVYDYDSRLLDDSQIHDLTFGWRWQYSPHLSLNAAAGPSYAVIDNQDDTWGYNGDIGLDYTLERGRIGLSVQKGLERQNFTGESELNGLIDYWNARASFSYQLLESTTFSVFAGYRYEDEDQQTIEAIADQVAEGTALAADTTLADAGEIDSDLIETITTQRLTAGCSLNYAFWQWYGLNLGYTYANQLSDTPEDEYDEHQIVLTLSFARELFRW